MLLYTFDRETQDYPPWSSSIFNLLHDSWVGLLGKADHLKYIHVVCLNMDMLWWSNTLNCLYWIPDPRKCGCRHQYVYHTLTSTGVSQSSDILDRCNRLRCPQARLSGLKCYNIGHNGHGIWEINMQADNLAYDIWA